jgi:hypothetical protein
MRFAIDEVVVAGAWPHVSGSVGEASSAVSVGVTRLTHDVAVDSVGVGASRPRRPLR